MRVRRLTVISVLVVMCCQLLWALVDFAPHNMTSDTAPPPYVAAASSEFNQFHAFMAFDNGVGLEQYWLGTNAGVDWLRLDIGSGNTKTLGSYGIRVNTVPEPARAPKDWTMEGSNDATSWSTLDTVTGQTSWGSGETRTFTCDVTTTAYRYFRLNITANNGDGTYTQVGELFLYELVTQTGFGFVDLPE